MLRKKKINLLGDPSVGKTSLILRYVNNIFNEEYLKTIGTNIYTKKISTISDEIKLIIHDIMGEKEYSIVQENAFRNSSGAIAVSDITNKKTLENIVDEWIPKYKNIAGNKPTVLAINKCDLKNKEITFDKILNNERYIENFEYIVFTSAKYGTNVEDLFKKISDVSVYYSKNKKENIEKILLKNEIKTPKDLLSSALALSSELTIMPYKKREEILKESNIDKFKLNEQISESNALYFTSGMSSWYNKKIKEEDNLENKSELIINSNVFLKLIRKYYENKF